jgi:hypothetical protein
MEPAARRRADPRPNLPLGTSLFAESHPVPYTCAQPSIFAACITQARSCASSKSFGPWISTRLVPAGECGLEIYEVSSFGGPDGDYFLAVTPIDSFESCDWAAGAYISSLEVSSGGMKGSTLVEIDVT